MRTLDAFQSPDRVSYQLSTGVETVIIGSVRYSRSTPTERWGAESTLPIHVPDFAWDSGPIQNATVVDAGEPGGEQVVSFFEAPYGSPVWFNLVVDCQALVRHPEMRSRGHF